MRTKLILPAVAAGALAVAFAIPTMADAASGGPAAPAAPAVRSGTPAKHVPPPVAGEKYPGDPYAGKCAYVLTGETQVRPCSAGSAR